jgi:hypothetical protein
VAALNEAAAKDVSVDNNAAVLLAQVMELSEFAEKDRATLFKRLGLDTPPKPPGPIQWFSNLVQEQDLDSVTTEPWPPDRFPAVAQWLTAKDRALDQAVEASTRPRCYFPLIRTAPGQSIYDLPLPAQQISREIGRALAARAMLRIHQGKVAEAKEDLLACHRLGRLEGSGPLILDGLLGLAIDNLASRADAALIEFGQLGASDALAYRDELSKLPPLPKIADHVDRGERLLFLGFVTELARSNHSRIEVPVLGPLNLLVESEDADLWDETLKNANREWDRWTAAIRTPIPSERRKRLQKLESQARQLLSEKSDSHKREPNPDKGRFLGPRLAVLLMPDAKSASPEEDQARVRINLVQTGLALAAYHADVGRYPDSLGELVPKYCHEEPRDPFFAKPLQYHRRADGYSLFSVGARSVTDQGNGPDPQPQSGDVVLAIPRQRVPTPSTARHVAEMFVGLAFFLFAPAVLGALLVVGSRLKGRPRPPRWLILAYALVTTTVLAFLAYGDWMLSLPLPGHISLALLAVAALGGAFGLIVSQLCGKPLPIWVVLGHAILVLAAFGAYFWLLYWIRMQPWSP